MVRVMRATIAVAVALSGLIVACRSADRNALRPAVTGPVGRLDDGTTALPVEQVLTPYGLFVDLDGMRPQAVAMSVDGTRVYVSGKTSELVVLDAAGGAVVQHVPLPSDARTAAPAEPVSEQQLDPDEKGQLSYTGLVVSPGGRRIYLSNVRGSVKVFTVDDDGTVHPSHSIPLPPANAPRREAEIPAGLACSDDGARLYVCGDLSNRLLEIDTRTGGVLRTIDVGVAPFDVVLVGDLAFVSNQGGPRPGPGDTVGPAGRGTVVHVDPVRFIADRGSVSVVDLLAGRVVAEVRTGLHASDLEVSPDQRYVVCANAGSDNLSILDATDGHVVDTVWMRAKPSDLLGATPNALAFEPNGDRLWVANGTQNAVALVDFAPTVRGASKLQGLVPVGWFPGALAFDVQRQRLVVANVKGLGFGRPRDGAGPEFNSHQYHGSVSIFDVASVDAQLERLSAKVEANLRRPAIERALLPPRDGVPARPIPERIGEPSPIQHVVYVIKENRSYDQVLGDMPEGNGDASLCVFGERVTPNQHALAREFVLLDNTYCAGILSADGHNWSTAAFANDYLEKSFAGFPRSYPDGMGEDESDALAYSPAGFLWDHAIARGLTLRNYGEFCEPEVHWADASRSGAPDFLACWSATQGKRDDVVFGCKPMVPSLEPYSAGEYVGWSMRVPDQYRADCFLRELAAFEAKGEFPKLVLICLPHDHTSGTKHGYPTPAASVADNDLALGRIVEGLSRSRFWPHMAIFCIEDDPQAGWDHVSGYRTTAFVVSPYARRGVTIGAQYATTSMLRTIEQILGIPPMNQFDASATPMWECFQPHADLTPFVAQRANVPLDQMNPAPAAIADPVLRADAVASEGFDFEHVDRAPEDALNRVLWRAMRGAAEPYPEWAVTPVADDD